MSFVVHNRLTYFLKF